jgi:Holliday junction resolvasome RuvABC DNA-binding subunit
MKAAAKLYVAVVTLLTTLITLACALVRLAAALVILLGTLCLRAADAAKRPARAVAVGRAPTTPEVPQVTTALVGLGFKRSEVARYVATMGPGDVRTQIQEGIRALGAN